MKLDDSPELLTVREYAQWARIGRNQAYEDVRSGRVPSVRLGGRSIRIPRRALEALVCGPAPPEQEEGPPLGGRRPFQDQRA